MARSEWGLGIRGLGLVYAYYSIIIIICAYVLYLLFFLLYPPHHRVLFVVSLFSFV